MTGNYEMKLPELNKFDSIRADATDLKDKVNVLQSEKRTLRLHINAKQDQINILITEIDKLESEKKC